ncbi:AAA family ATPase [Lacrimispora xylanisolvens]|uniref:AAA family ATPase n=1 Tax=Lacrimispora xylanisolvens TaxID=384636 RepID=UPI0024028701
MKIARTENVLERIEGMGVKRILPIGNDDFRKLRENESYYVDKTLMIKDFIEMQDEVTLIARPRRFGKTLNVTMLKEFLILKRIAEIFLMVWQLWIRNTRMRLIQDLSFILHLKILKEPR